MLTRTRFRVAVGVAMASFWWLAPMVAQVQQPRAPVPFRAGVTLVPVDIRVVDADGNPVTNLKAADFTIFENGVRQDIAHFSTQSSLAATPETAGSSARAPRTFFIVLGRGRLNDPGKGLDAIIEFVRSRLVPGDRVAVLAFLHLAELTTDREAVVRLLERYRARHEAIDDKLDRDGKRIRAGAPDWPLAPDTQVDLAALFDAPGLPRIQLFPGGSGGKQINFWDGGYLRRMIEYLRYVEGEKHLVLMVERAVSQADSYAQSAAAARATVSVIQTGGMRPPRPLSGKYGGTFDSSPNATEMMGFLADRALAEETGGVAGFYQSAAKSLDRLIRTTSFEYLLGYYPAKPPADGEYRELRVEVRRRGVTALYRHGYEAQPPPIEPLDLRRIFAEAGFRNALPVDIRLANIPMDLKARLNRGPGEAMTIDVDIAIDPKWVTFVQKGEEWTTCIDVAAFARDAGEKVLGEQRGRIDLKLDAKAYAQQLRERIRYTIAVSVATGHPAHVKVLLYEYEGSRTAHATVRLR
ncbi:MAG: VWA domain-containing protein [Acidobacteria bacterium]|nr:VWA domain-containing protein [Acidobacteriota bacterium]